MFESGLLERTPYSVFNIYRNNVIAAVSVKEFKWAEMFAKQYIKHIELNDRDSMLNYALGYIKFTSKEYKDAINYINRIKMIDVVLRYDIYTWQLIIYYELGFYENSINTIASAVQFLKQRKSKLITHTEFDNFITAYKMILNLKEKFDDNNLQKVRVFMQKTGSILYRNWLNEKINNLLTILKRNL
jgi:tetratricopeptide (TPR) repeat protein